MWPPLTVTTEIDCTKRHDLAQKESAFLRQSRPQGLMPALILLAIQGPEGPARTVIPASPSLPNRWGALMTRFLRVYEGQADGGARAFAVFAIDEVDFAAVSAGDLLGQCEADTAAGGLGGVEGHE